MSLACRHTCVTCYPATLDSPAPAADEAHPNPISVQILVKFSAVKLFGELRTYWQVSWGPVENRCALGNGIL
jgi:hypothetical protein